MSDWNYHFGIELLNQASHLLKHGYRQQGLDTFQNQGKLYADQVRGNLEEQYILDSFANIACPFGDTQHVVMKRAPETPTFG
jgi:hypothetical protein